MEPMRSAFIQKQSRTGRKFPTAKINASEKKCASHFYHDIRVENGSKYTQISHTEKVTQKFIISNQ
jgi:hypothetical protein